MAVYIVPIATMATLLVTAVLLLFGKAGRIAAAFNSMPKDKKNMVDEKALGRFLGKCILALTGCLLLLFLGAWFARVWMMIAGILAIVAVVGAALLYSSPDDRFQCKLPKND